mmetsp:Transcript_21863/g.38670  ORF Transcript_21863/g.38670 Transcript_21863/m.38670 type:complete len:391 (-) Transcript_21863:1152-2324(-)
MSSHEEDAQALVAVLDRSNKSRLLGKQITQFVTQLKRKKIESSFLLTQETLRLVRQVIKSKRWDSVAELLQVVRALGRRLVQVRASDLVVGNVFRRVMHTIRAEYFSMLKDEQNQSEASSEAGDADSRRKAVVDAQQFDPKCSVLPSREIGMHAVEFMESSEWNLGSEVASAITEMLSELENLSEPICHQALEHIEEDDVVLIFGASKTVEVFLMEAKRKRNFKVVVAEASPSLTGRGAAKKLADHGISTTLIADSAIFAVMSRVTKVILGTNAVMANGGLMARAGTHSVALAAKHHAVPVVCVTGLYKLCPLFPYKSDSFITLKSPGSTTTYASLGGLSDNVKVITAGTDFVPPDLISLFVTNTGGHQPSYVYRLLSDYYDINAEEELE